VCAHARVCMCVNACVYTHTHTYASHILCTELHITCIKAKYQNVDKVASTTKNVWTGLPKVDNEEDEEIQNYDLPV
jgi:hypothetical protein